MITTVIDQSGLDSMLNGVRDALIGTGGDATELTKDESRLLAMQLMRQGQPKDRMILAAKIEKNVHNRFVLLDMELNTGEHGLGIGKNGTFWYAADKSFLYGADQAKDMTKAAGDQIADVFYSSKVKGGKARLIYDFNPPRKGGQRAAITRRIITSKASLARGVKAVQQSIGKLAASWFGTAKTIDALAKAPEFIGRHLHGSRTTKSITDLTELNKADSPAVTFGSKAHAVATEKSKQGIQFAMNVRTKKLAARMKLILSGYSKDVANGIRVQRKAKKIKGVE